MASALEEIKALAFDVFGTVVDYRTIAVREGDPVRCCITMDLTNDPSFISKHPRSSSNSRREDDQLTKILTKTARLPTAIYDARAHQERGRFGFTAVSGALWRSGSEPVKGLWIS